MSAASRAPRRPSLAASLLLALALTVAGCAAPREEAARPSALTVYVPCVLGAPINRVVSTYQSAHPDLEIAVRVEKPLSIPARVRAPQQAPAAVITMGDREMDGLVSAGAVRRDDVRAIAVNTYPIVAVVPAEGAEAIRSLDDLASPAAASVFIEDPAVSSLGHRAESALRAAGLWQAIAPKVVRPEPDTMVLAELIAGNADAALVFRDCLFAEGDTDRVPKTIRVVGELPEHSYERIVYQAAPLAAWADAAPASDFVTFLASPQGAEALDAAGLEAVQ